MYLSNTNVEAARLFSEVSKIIKQTIRKNFEGADITMPQSMVLHTLCKYGEMKISDISEQIHLSSSTVSGIVDRLENHGLVIRTRNCEDRRTVYVNVTRKFIEEYKGHKKIEESFLDLLSSATPEDMDKIIDGLNTLKRILMDRKES
jgi:DNA-binding MarR family transcriptional regulator